MLQPNLCTNLIYPKDFPKQIKGARSRAWQLTRPERMKGVSEGRN